MSSLPRYLKFTSPIESNVEVLESFAFSGKRREFNLRLRSGVWPDDATLAERVRQEFNLPDMGYQASFLSLAGDKTLVINIYKEIPVEQRQSDDKGISPRPDDAPQMVETPRGGWRKAKPGEKSNDPAPKKGK